MNFWTWLDRNGDGVFWLVVIGLCFAFGECGDHRGCHIRCGDGAINMGPDDAGAQMPSQRDDGGK